MFWHTHALKMTLATCSSCAIGEKTLKIMRRRSRCKKEETVQYNLLFKNRHHVSFLTEICNQIHSLIYASIRAGFSSTLALGCTSLDSYAFTRLESSALSS